MDYSPFNPEVWGTFAVCAVLVWMTVRAYRWRHPDYPGKWPEDDK